MFIASIVGVAGFFASFAADDRFCFVSAAEGISIIDGLAQGEAPAFGFIFKAGSNAGVTGDGAGSMVIAGIGEPGTVVIPGIGGIVARGEG